MFQVVIAEPIAPEGLSLLEAASDVSCAHLTDADRPDHRARILAMMDTVFAALRAADDET